MLGGVLIVVLLGLLFCVNLRCVVAFVVVLLM